VGVGQKPTDIHALVWAHTLAHQAISWHLCRIFGTVEARNFEFGKRIDLGKSHLMDDKITPKGAWSRSKRPIFKIMGPPLGIYLDRVKLDNSRFNK